LCTGNGRCDRGRWSVHRWRFVRRQRGSGWQRLGHWRRIGSRWRLRQWERRQWRRIRWYCWYRDRGHRHRWERRHWNCGHRNCGHRNCGHWKCRYWECRYWECRYWHSRHGWWRRNRWHGWRFTLPQLPDEYTVRAVRLRPVHRTGDGLFQQRQRHARQSVSSSRRLREGQQLHGHALLLRFRQLQSSCGALRRRHPHRRG
jgi:hypothetical protein